MPIINTDMPIINTSVLRRFIKMWWLKVSEVYLKISLWLCLLKILKVFKVYMKNSTSHKHSWDCLNEQPLLIMDQASYRTDFKSQTRSLFCILSSVCNGNKARICAERLGAASLFWCFSRSTSGRIHLRRFLANLLPCLETGLTGVPANKLIVYKINVRLRLAACLCH